MRINTSTIRLIPIESIKRQTNIVCKECGLPIMIGDKYVHVKSNDTFITRPYGGFHPDCWESFKLNNFKK